jgi:cell wall assembly regulator SMI1
MTNTELFIKNIEGFGHSLSGFDFSEGASDEQIDEVEKLIKRTLPDDFKLFLKNINGQHSDKLYLLPDQALLFSCEEIISEYKGLTDFFEDTIEFYNKYQYNDKIRCSVWSESRVPIAGRDGYYLFLDFDPGPNGTIGQVIFLINECDLVVLASSFKNFLNSYNDHIKNKTLQIREISNGQDSNYRLTNDSDYLNGQEFAKLFGQ